MSACHISITVHHKRKSGQKLRSMNLEGGADAETMEGYCLLTCSPWLPYPAFFSAQDHLPRAGTAHSQHSHVYHQSRNACPRLAHRPPWLGSFSQSRLHLSHSSSHQADEKLSGTCLYYSSADLFIYFFTAQELYFLRPLPFSLIVSESLCSVQILFTVTQWLECLKSRNLELGCDFATESW